MLTKFDGCVLLAMGLIKVNTSSGVYTFDSADQDVPVFIAYTYSIADQGFVIGCDLGWKRCMDEAGT
jgi:hypothetical protein